MAMINIRRDGIEMTKRLMIFGGTGFFGQVFIQQAIQMGYQVISVSRTGKPKKAASWQERVHWVAADVFQPEKWRHYLKEVDVLIDAVGIIKETPSKSQTYERLNTEAAQLLAIEGKNAGIPLFVYLSAQSFTKLFLKEYFASKKAAEVAVLLKYPQAIIIRPSLIVGPTRKGTRLLQQLSPFVRLIFPTFQPQPVAVIAKETLQKIKEHA